MFGYTLLWYVCESPVAPYSPIITINMKCCLQATEMDISKQLHAYEVEYHVLQDELSDAPPPSEDSDRLDKLEKANSQLKKQNMDLLEKLQVDI